MSGSAEEGTKTMRVKILSNVAGRPSYVSGEIVDLEPRIAKAWIEDGIAAAARDEPPVERATK